MAFKAITIMDIWDIIRRYRDGQTIRSIARTLGFDRKTVRKYIKFLRARGISFAPTIPLVKEPLVRAMERKFSPTQYRRLIYAMSRVWVALNAMKAPFSLIGEGPNCDLQRDEPTVGWGIW